MALPFGTWTRGQDDQGPTHEYARRWPVVHGSESLTVGEDLGADVGEDLGEDLPRGYELFDPLARLAESPVLAARAAPSATMAFTMASACA
jgi:hypothetical protein